MNKNTLNIKKVVNNNKKNNYSNNKNNIKNNINNLNVNNAINKIKNNSKKSNKKIIFILALIFLIIVIGLLGYYIYKEYPELIPFGKDKLEEEKIQNNLNRIKEMEELNRQAVEEQNARERERRTQEDNMVNLLSNVNDNSVNRALNNKKQVYNIENNIFSYEDAEAACKAHGSDLATYEQVVDAYRKGAEWCNLGWSQNQMALYPTQKKTWEKLQEDPESANSCGDWGVNGGYYENQDTLFGANCYGIKPEPKDRERERNVPVSVKQRDILQKVKMYKENKNDLTISPFNANLWSQK